jgi:hypothetical protein
MSDTMSISASAAAIFSAEEGCGRPPPKKFIMDDVWGGVMYKCIRWFGLDDWRKDWKLKVLNGVDGVDRAVTARTSTFLERSKLHHHYISIQLFRRIAQPQQSGRTRK